MKGYEHVSIQNRACVIVYRGEHYAIRYYSGRTVRMSKERIIKKFHLHHDALERYIGGDFKRCWAMANEDVVKVARSLSDVERFTFLVTSLVVMIPQVFLILAVLLGFIDGHALRPYVVPIVFASFAAMFAAIEIPEYLYDKYDFVLGIEREA